MRGTSRPGTDRSPSLNLAWRGAGAAACLILTLAAAACDESPTAPSTDLSGAWNFTYSAFDQASCPGLGGLMRGCAGSGQLTFGATTPQVDATHSFRGFCQSCQRAADYGISQQPLSTARIAGGVLEFALAACRFAAEIPPTPAQTAEGTVGCTPDAATGQEVRGDWTMSRQ
jgi:hypothetical protein